MSSANFTTPIPLNEPVKTYAANSPEKLLLKQELQAQKATVDEITPMIGNYRGKGSETSTITSPQNHELVLATVKHTTPAEVDMAIQSALDARKDWAGLPWEDRAAVFLKAAELLSTKYRPVLSAATMLGQSKTAHQAEIDAACELIDFFRFNVKYAEQIYSQQPNSSVGIWNKSSARALEGFVFAVTPFNFTAIALNLCCAPALMGCTVVWKPAPTSTYSSYLGMKMLEEAGLPPGVINFIPGDPQMIGEKVLSHPSLSGVHFTGSTNTFNYIWKTVGSNIDKYKSYPRIVGETGGKDFVFAHPSANLEELSIALIRGSFEYQGQKCSAASRAYIPKSIWPELKGRLVSLCADIKVGDPEDFTNFMSAVIDKRSFDKIAGYIEHAKNSSEADVITGGGYDDQKGYFIEPTIIEASSPTYKSMVEEIFGPVLSIYVYEDNKIEETLTLVDESTPYSLTGAIFAQDRLTINHLTNRLENAAGNFYVNDKPTGAVVGQQPFGGARASGTNDKAGSIYNLIRWTSHRTIKENFTPVSDYRYPFMDEE